jgi:Uncharacterized lipoprotein
MDRAATNGSIQVVYLLIVLCLGGCSTTIVDLPYAPASQNVTKQNPIIDMGTVTDRRKNESRSLGSIRNGYGGALKSLETAGPVADVIKAAFNNGLKARGLEAPPGKGTYRLDVTVLKFDCNQYVRREAHAEFQTTLVLSTTEKIEYTHIVVDKEVQGSLIAFDTAIFASVEDQRKVANDLLQRAVDEALDDPGLRAHLIAD